MDQRLNLKLKNGVEPSVLVKYGFAPKYDEDTGEIKEYKKKIHIAGKKPDESYFTFVLCTKHIMGGIFRRRFYYEAWMSGFSWNNVCEKESLQLLYDLFVDGIVEPAPTAEGG